MKVHITLVGGQPAPVYHGIMATKPDMVVYIYSKETSKAVDTLVNELNYKYEKIMLDPTAPQIILGTVVQLADKYKSDEVTVNISGGLKSWSHFFGLIFDRQPNAAVVYMDQNNVLWNYKDMTSSRNFNFDMHTLFRLYGNSLDNNYSKFEDYTEEDIAAIGQIERIRMHNVSDFNKLTAVLSKENANILKTRSHGQFSLNSGSYVEWEKTNNYQEGYVHLCLYNKAGIPKEFEHESRHITDIMFNSGWFELKIAHLLSKWEMSMEICMNCRFPYKQGVDKNETDVIVNTGTKILFVECKTQIAKPTDIDKFRSVVKAYGGTGSKGLFITDAKMKDVSREKCEENKILSFSLQDYPTPEEQEKALFSLLNMDLFNINA